jgi:hypothetical protein
MFEIESKHIERLNEEDLRELVGLLCEAELASKGLPLSAVTRGGHQNAGDGGIDVRVSLPVGSPTDDFVPRPDTGYQVKQTDMPASAIIEEMKPSNMIRPVIVELAQKSGAYIIVSSQGSVADFALANRIKKMNDAVSGIANSVSLKLDFYDRTRLATWVRKYPGLVPWVRARTQTPIAGWQSFAPWSGDKDTSFEYLQDSAIRIKSRRHDDGDGFSPADGIKRIRDILRQPGKVVRLVGLSGVGKTRLVQALFDERVGSDSLDKSAVAYTNIADSPDPTPVELITHLINSRKRMVIVVDNCQPELHRRITEVCGRTGSTLSAITIEYDIREDEAEGTEVFSLEPASAELIERLVRVRRSDISQVDARTIAEFSGGNARVAFALVKTIETNGTIAGLKDEDLFQRLFLQRHDYDADLLRVAEACSIVYSFNGDDVTGDSELSVLGRLAGKPTMDVFRNVAELRDRDLVQSRSVWRAILPHALANRLASNALRRIPVALITERLISGASDRLKKSFSRRLGFLHESKEAQQFVSSWFSAEGLLSDVNKFDDTELAIFNNVAPVLPEGALRIIERSLTLASASSVSNLVALSGMIRTLAYDASLFDRCIDSLARISSLSESHQARIDEQITSLFYVYLSGTHASIEQRLEVIDGLVKSDDSHRRALGFRALNATLEASHFYSDHTFGFGSRSRDYGYWPSTDKEIRQWYGAAFEFSRSLALSDSELSTEAAATLASQLRGLWSRVGLYDQITLLCKQISASRFWPEGWRAVRETIHFDASELTPELQATLASLEEQLRPKDLVHQIHSIVFDENYDFLDDSDRYKRTAMIRPAAVAQRFGKQVAGSPSTFVEILPELSRVTGRVFAFAQGLAKLSPDPRKVWDALVEGFAKTVEPDRRTAALGGFLSGLKKRDEPLLQNLLDAALTDNRISKIAPLLQANVGLDDIGWERLQRALALSNAPIETYRALSGGKATHGIPGTKLASLLKLIGEKGGGNDVAIDILSMRFVGDPQSRDTTDLVLVGQQLMQNFSFQGSGSLRDHRTALVIRFCLLGAQGAIVAHSVAERFFAELSKVGFQASNFYEMIVWLVATQPKVMLSAFLLGDAKSAPAKQRALRSIARARAHPFAKVSADAVISWCNEDPTIRFPLAGIIVQLAEQVEERPVKWTDMTLRLLAESPDRCAVLRTLADRFFPKDGWSGSLVGRLEAYHKLLVTLYVGADEAFAACIKEQEEKLVSLIEEQKKFEKHHQRKSDETFE